jgi:predicted DNA binding CopG/RHH family protein
MKAFFNSKGYAIGFESEKNLYNLSGIHFAQNEPTKGIYTDLNGSYIGEIIGQNRNFISRDCRFDENFIYKKISQKPPIKIPKYAKFLDCPQCSWFTVGDGRFSEVAVNKINLEDISTGKLKIDKIAIFRNSKFKRISLRIKENDFQDLKEKAIENEITLPRLIKSIFNDFLLEDKQ